MSSGNFGARSHIPTCANMAKRERPLSLSANLDRRNSTQTAGAKRLHYSRSRRVLSPMTAATMRCESNMLAMKVPVAAERSFTRNARAAVFKGVVSTSSSHLLSRADSVACHECASCQLAKDDCGDVMRNGEGGLRILAGSSPYQPIRCIPLYVTDRLSSLVDHTRFHTHTAPTTRSNVTAGRTAATTACSHRAGRHKPRARYPRPMTGQHTLPASHQGDPGSIPGRATPDPRMWELRWTMSLVGGFTWGSPASPSPHSGAAPYSLQSPSSALKISMLRANHLTHPSTPAVSKA
ncbi:hypothetical protein PR048_003016 [Dryococelus australis]|uniref:Uncharacterized protein n=1 Tax=Dryococelus australis TaxID=614101 RepID=A0ABQ9IMW2_9NEOP|nr:hypothetical protein PR048_003016 [Dryococelus australis]